MQPIQRPPTQSYGAPQPPRPTQTPGCWPSTHHRGQQEATAGASYNVQHSIKPVNLLHVSSNSSHLDVHRSCMLRGRASGSELFKTFSYGLAMLNKILVISEYIFLMYFRTYLEGRLRIKVTLRSRLCLKRSRDKPVAPPPPRASHLMQ